jgi:hypothetical protein
LVAARRDLLVSARADAHISLPNMIARVIVRVTDNIRRS